MSLILKVGLELQNTIQIWFQHVVHCAGGRRGAVLSLGCEYDKDGGPTDLLSPAAAAWFSAASWPLATVAEVIANIRQEGGVQHCIQVTPATSQMWTIVPNAFICCRPA